MCSHVSFSYDLKVRKSSSQVKNSNFFNTAYCVIAQELQVNLAEVFNKCWKFIVLVFLFFLKNKFITCQPNRRAISSYAYSTKTRLGGYEFLFQGGQNNHTTNFQHLTNVFPKCFLHWLLALCWSTQKAAESLKYTKICSKSRNLLRNVNKQCWGKCWNNNFRRSISHSNSLSLHL